jgi:hypothetical protein
MFWLQPVPVDCYIHCLLLATCSASWLLLARQVANVRFCVAHIVVVFVLQTTKTKLQIVNVGCTQSDVWLQH